MLGGAPSLACLRKDWGNNCLKLPMVVDFAGAGSLFNIAVTDNFPAGPWREMSAFGAWNITTRYLTLQICNVRYLVVMFQAPKADISLQGPAGKLSVTAILNRLPAPAKSTTIGSLRQLLPQSFLRHASDGAPPNISPVGDYVGWRSAILQ